MLSCRVYIANYLIIVLSCLFLNYSVTLYRLSLCTINNTGPKSESVPKELPDDDFYA